MSKPTLLIFGATGQQGGSVIDSLLQTGRFNLRAVSRNAQSEKAQDLSILSLFYCTSMILN
jgi:uncharacterized protein YbjT (DUF2867 family)